MPFQSLKCDCSLDLPRCDLSCHRKPCSGPADFFKPTAAPSSKTKSKKRKSQRSSSLSSTPQPLIPCSRTSNPTPMTPHQIAEEEKRLRRAEAWFWLNKDQCPECPEHPELIYTVPRRTLFQLFTFSFTLDSEALCSCGARVTDLETHHWWSTYEVTPAAGTPYWVTIDE